MVTKILTVVGYMFFIVIGIALLPLFWPLGIFFFIHLVMDWLDDLDSIAVLGIVFGSVALQTWWVMYGYNIMMTFLGLGGS